MGKVSKKEGFYTMKGYAINEDNELTASMEDYLEMICRMVKEGQQVHVGDLSKMLHVQPSSTTKMIQQLNLSGYINSKKYGTIYLTKKGEKTGQYLLERHKIIHDFLCALNKTENELEQVEKIEHFLNRTTVYNLKKITDLIK